MDPDARDLEAARGAVSVARAGAGPWRLTRGARPLPGGGTSFAVWAPNARSVAVRLRGGRAGEDDRLEAHGRGVFEGVIPAARAGTDYWYVLDGGPPRPDPVSRWQPDGPHGPSRVVDPDAFNWTDGGWRGRAMADLVIYELHVGAFSEAGTFDGVIGHLDELVRLGVTAIEIMPVAQFPGARNWGYDGVLPYAVQTSYGGPHGLKRLVDAAHARELAVVLDVVYNHVGPEGNYLDEYGPYFTDTYRTPWGRAVNYDGPDSDEVRRMVIDNALHWIAEYHVDALRLDAIHGIFDFGAVHLLRELGEACHALGRQLGRRVLVIGESDLNDPRVVRPRERGGHGLDAQWSDDLHHAIHAELTGERAGYYADFGGAAAIARALAERFVYDGRYSAHRRRRHGAPAMDVPADRFVVAIQNHDQTGNRARGERLAVLVPFERLKVAAALLLLSPYVPLLFMGEEYGETRPFLYFVSHGDAQLLAAVREGRRREFASFGWGDNVPDPAAPETFARSVLDRSASGTGRGAALRALYRELIAVRRSRRELRPGDAAIAVRLDESAPAITTLFTLPAGAAPTLAAVFNLGPDPAPLDLPGTGEWRRLLSTEEPRFGGSSPDAPAGRIVPMSAALFAATEPRRTPEP